MYDAPQIIAAAKALFAAAAEQSPDFKQKQETGDRLVDLVYSTDPKVIENKDELVCAHPFARTAILFNIIHEAHAIKGTSDSYLHNLVPGTLLGAALASSGATCCLDMLHTQFKALRGHYPNTVDTHHILEEAEDGASYLKAQIYGSLTDAYEFGSTDVLERLARELEEYSKLAKKAVEAISAAPVLPPVALRYLVEYIQVLGNHVFFPPKNTLLAFMPGGAALYATGLGTAEIRAVLKGPKP